MHISRISIKNFRSIDSVVDLEFGRFNVLVGKNNHGKTNFFEAIEWFYNGAGDIQEIKRKNSGDDEMFVEIEFANVQGGIERMSEKSKNKPKIKSIVGNLETARVRQIWHKDGAEKYIKEKQIYNSKEGEWEVPTCLLYTSYKRRGSLESPGAFL